MHQPVRQTQGTRITSDFSPPINANRSPQRKMFPERNLHVISHNAVFTPHPQDPMQEPQQPVADSRNQVFSKNNSAPSQSQNKVTR